MYRGIACWVENLGEVTAGMGQLKSCLDHQWWMRTSPTGLFHIDIINQKRVMGANFEVGESLQVNHTNENIIPSSTKHLENCGYHDKHTEEPRDV
jgi:hypothetical protein